MTGPAAWAVAVSSDPAKTPPTFHIYGPFSDYPEAVDFAAFMTAEVDPAFVWPLHSPLGELLSWSASRLEQAAREAADVGRFAHAAIGAQSWRDVVDALEANA